MRFARSIVPGAALLVSAVLGIVASTTSAQTYVLGRVFGRAKVAIKQARSQFSTIAVSLLAALLIVFGSLTVFSTDALAQNPVPFINQPLVPDATAPGGPQFRLTVSGTGFVSSSVVNWNTTALATQFVSGSQLTATVPAADIAIAGTASVTVVNPTPGGGTSNVVFFTVAANTSTSVAFTLASYLSVGIGPYPIAVGDFNRDGKLDLAVVNSCGTDPSCNSGTVSILLGDGTGNFTLASSPGTGDSPSGLVVGDFSGDGELDLAIPNYSDDTVSILLGDGTGNFTLASSPATGSGPNSVVAGDFNGDGKLDLAVANKASNTVSILLGDGTGNFTPASSPATGSGPNSVAAGDFNGDGKLDLAVVNENDNTVSILLGDGTGDFTLTSSPITGVYPQSVAVGDFNGDGKLDLAVANGGSNTISILLGDGTGNFTLASSPATGISPGSVTVGDFNADGKLDLAVANTCGDPGCDLGYPGSVFILVGDGTGNFTLVSSPGTGDFPSGIAVGDFDGDGKLDLAVANNPYPGTVSILLQVAASAGALSPSSLVFGTQSPDTTSAAQTVTFTNTSRAPINITSIVASGDFAETNNCGNSLASGKSCTISVTFSPTQTGIRTGSLTVTDSAPGSPLVVSLSGAGALLPGMSLLPPSLNFQSCGNPVSQPATLTNNSPSAVTISSIAIGPTFLGSCDGSPGCPDFSQTNNCGTSLQADQSCLITVSYSSIYGVPTYGEQAELVVAAAGTGGAGASLSGVTWVCSSTISANPLSLEFGFQPVGVTSSPQTIALNGNQPQPPGLSATVTGDFSASVSPPNSFARDQWNSTVTVTLTPTMAGISTGSVTINATGSNGLVNYTPVVIPLSGIGGSQGAAGQNTVPLINQPLVPDATPPGGPEFTLTLNGTGFVSGSVVHWNTAPLATQFVSGSQLTATVPADDIVTAGTASVTVVNPAPSGTSNVAFFMVAANSGNSVSFNLASSLPTNAGLIAVGDFNGDGKLDAAVSNCTGTDAPGTVSILLGDGTGNFTLTSSAGAGNCPSSIAVGDFNGDGKLDLAVANSFGNTVSILLGDGTGNFTLASSPAVGSGPGSMAVGDFNGDGKLDLAVPNGCGDDPSCFSPGTVSILLGDGTGNFAQVSSPAVGAGAESVAVGDFNGDGNLDLAVANGGTVFDSCSSVSILLGDGTGNFTLASPTTQSVGPPVAVGDFNGDGKLDLAVAGGTCGGAVSIMLGDGTGDFTLTQPPPGDYGLEAVGDFNGDSKLDLAVANRDSDSAVSILLGDGTGNFTLASPPTTGVQSDSAAVGDFNGDGKLDLAVVSFQNNTISILLQPSPAVSLSPISLAFATQSVSTTSGPQTVTLSNSGKASLFITNVAASGDFSETNTCGGSVTAGGSCTISVTFTPTASGARTGTLTITDNAAGGPQIVSLTGTGIVSPAVTLSASTVSAGGQVVGTASAAHTVTLTNTGNAALNITSIAITPAAFTETNKCGTSLAAGASCTITVMFTPSSAGEISGTLTITDNALGSPHRVSLSGVGQDFSIGPYNLSATVIPGATTSCAFQVAPLGGFNQTVSLACSGAPQEATCTLNPTSVVLDGRNRAAIGLQLSTTAPTSGGASGGRWPVLPPSREWFVAMGAAILLGLLGLSGLLLGLLRRHSLLARSGWKTQAGQLRLCLLVLLGILLIAVIGWAACGGAGAPVFAPPTGGTPAGHYTLTVTATSGHLTHSTTTQLTVQ